MSEDYSPDNVLDRLSSTETLELQYEQMHRRERELLDRRLPSPGGGDVLSVGCGARPGRHLFPAPAFRLVGVDLDPEKVRAAVEWGGADSGFVGRAGSLGLEPSSFDVVLYRLTLHHIAYQGPLGPCFEEAARLLRPGGAMVAVEPGLWHPVGALLALANRSEALARLVHGTPDDIPLSPRALEAEARAAGLRPELHAVTYTWRRMPRPLQRALWRLDEHGSNPRLAPFGHHLMLIARKPG
ncbi:MAG: Methyltransferase domain [Thermoleophilaceae bacterium]|nr:Methyltransferase domain [Thermoleophilaceae bacterium]